MDPKNVISNPVYESLQAPTQDKDNGYPSTILYANKFSGIDEVPMPEDIRKLLDDYSLGLAGTKNILVQLNHIFNHYQNGPWFVDSINGIIYIHNHRKVAEPDYDYYYAQEEGEVLSCSISTNWVAKRVSGGIVTSGISPSGDLVASLAEPQNDGGYISPFQSGSTWKDYKAPPLTTFAVPRKPRVTYQRVFTSITGYNQSLVLDKTGSENRRKAREAAAKRQKRTDDLYNLYSSMFGMDPDRVNDPRWVAEYRAKNSRPISEYSEEEQEAMAIDAYNTVLSVYQKENFLDRLKSDNVESIEEFMKSLPLYEVPGTSGLPDIKYKVITSKNYTEHSGFYEYEKLVSNVGSTVLGAVGTIRGGLGTGAFTGFGSKKLFDSIIEIAEEEDGVKATTKARAKEISESGAYRLLDGSHYDDKNNVGILQYFTPTEGRQTYSMTALYEPLKRALKKGKLEGGDSEGVEEIIGINGNGAANKSARLQEKKVEMQLRVIGRPTLQSSQTLYIGGIGKKWSGNWYVKTCIHQFDSSGYTCSLTLSKGPESKGNVSVQGLSQNTTTRGGALDGGGSSGYSAGGKYKEIKTKSGTFTIFLTWAELEYLNELESKQIGIKSSKASEEDKKAALKDIKTRRDILITAKLRQYARGKYKETVSRTGKRAGSLTKGETTVSGLELNSQAYKDGCIPVKPSDLNQLTKKFKGAPYKPE